MLYTNKFYNIKTRYDENETLTLVRADAIRGIGSGLLESMIVSTATAGAGKYVQIGVGVVYFLSDSKGNIDSSIKLSSELKKENALKYATYVEVKDSQLS